MSASRVVQVIIIRLTVNAITSSRLVNILSRAQASNSQSSQFCPHGTLDEFSSQVFGRAPSLPTAFLFRRTIRHAPYLLQLRQQRTAWRPVFPPPSPAGPLSISISPQQAAPAEGPSPHRNSPVLVPRYVCAPVLPSAAARALSPVQRLMNNALRS